MKKIRVCNTVAYLILMILFLCVAPFVVPKAFGYEPYGILSDSMEPEYAVGSLVYVKKCAASDIQVRDVITFKQSVASNQVATHRVVAIDEKEQTFTTKGDHNADVDAGAVSFQRLIGKVVLGVPMLGTFYLWLVSISGMAIASFALCIALLLWYLVSRWKKDLKAQG